MSNLIKNCRVNLPLVPDPKMPVCISDSVACCQPCACDNACIVEHSQVPQKLPMFFPTPEIPKRPLPKQFGNSLCRQRIEELAIPSLKHINRTLENYHYLLGPERVVRLVKLIHEIKEPKPKRHYWNIKQLLKKKRRKRQKCPKKNKKESEKKWLEKQIAVSAKLVLDYIKSAEKHTPNYKQLQVGVSLLKSLKVKKPKDLKGFTKRELHKVCQQIAILFDTKCEPYKGGAKLEHVTSEATLREEDKKECCFKMGEFDWESEVSSEAEEEEEEGELEEEEEGEEEEEERKKEVKEKWQEGEWKEEGEEWEEEDEEHESEMEGHQAKFFTPNELAMLEEEEGMHEDLYGDNGEEYEEEEFGEDAEGRKMSSIKEDDLAEEQEGREGMVEAKEKGFEKESDEKKESTLEEKEMAEELESMEEEGIDESWEDILEELLSEEGEEHAWEAPEDLIPPPEEEEEEVEEEEEEEEKEEEKVAMEEAKVAKEKEEAAKEEGKEVEEEPKRKKESRVELPKSHPEGTCSYVSWSLYSSWLNEFGNNMDNYTTCLKRFREAISRDGTSRHNEAMTNILSNWSKYLKETTEVEKNMTSYFKDKPVTQCVNCVDSTIDNYPHDHEIPDELLNAIKSTNEWRQMLADAERQCNELAEQEESTSSEDIQIMDVSSSASSGFLIEDVR